MAMAHLFSALLKTHRDFRIADNPAAGAIAIIIDHKLRPESSSEAAEVARELRNMGVRSMIKTLTWKDAARLGQDPANLPNVESVARTLRYRMLGLTCRYSQISSLFFGHHRDDQYETVLMRYMNGHPYRGYQGIREANAIPECHDLHGVYKSGLLDDQMHKYPCLSFKPSKKEMKRLRWMMKSDSEAEAWDKFRFCLGINDMSGYFISNDLREAPPRVPYLTPLNCEDGGVMIYRPLLQFDKDRLIATCEANKIKWFEDSTNADATLTPRNAIRHMDRTTVPAEWQKHVILDMSREAKRRVRLEEAEARRWLIREAAILDFDPNAGTLLAELPAFQVANPQWRRRRLFARARSKSRQPQQRLIAAIVIRKLIEFVTPDTNVPSLTNLDNVVDRLFPKLAAEHLKVPPKAFTIAGVVFEPRMGTARAQWFLSRAPYPSNKPLPELKLLGYLHSRLSLLGDAADDAAADVAADKFISRHHRHWRTWKIAKLWDGRYWIRVSACAPARFHILPFMPQYAKPFRKALPTKQLARLDQILKYYAPGKIRYSLPALYNVEAVVGQDENPTLTLLALPTLGIQVPGLERWVKCETRYRWVDASLLGRHRRRKSHAVPKGGVEKTWKKPVKRSAASHCAQRRFGGVDRCRTHSRRRR
ncbi:hypothetical protein E4U21_007458 [Claviceps maximensis]|nr:hypothetical protein E4U21_007458 [Claviceps maximensis]